MIPPTQAAKLVTTAAMTARMLAARAEPALNPNHPTHKEDGTDDDVSNVVWAVVELMSTYETDQLHAVYGIR